LKKKANLNENNAPMDKKLREKLREDFMKYEGYWINSEFLKALLFKLHTNPTGEEIKFGFVDFHRSFINLRDESIHPFTPAVLGNDIDMLKNKFITQTEAFFWCYYVLPVSTSKSNTVRIIWESEQTI
jgi:hypothetical protein